MCGNNMCETGETPAGCAQDCAASLLVENISTRYVVTELYIYGCTAPAEGGDQLRGNWLFAGDAYTVGGLSPGCYLFHAKAFDGSSWRSKTGSTLEAGHEYTWSLGD